MIYNFDGVYENIEDALGALEENGSVKVNAETANEMVSDDSSLSWSEYPSIDDNGYEIDWIGKTCDLFLIEHR